MNPLSRFILVEHYALSPGVCYTCRSNKTPAIDTQVNVDWEGRVYLCQDCVKELHSQLGLNVVLNAEELDERAMKAFQEGFASGKAVALEAINDAVSAAVAVVTYDVHDTPVSDSVPEISEPLFIGVVEDKPEPVSGFEQVDFVISEPGREGVSGDSSDGDSRRTSLAAFGI